MLHPDLEHLINRDNSNPSIYLVDHNSVNIKQSYMDKFVHGIVDHHFDEKLHLNSKIRNLHPVCSCTSLVVLMIKKRLEELQISDYKESMPPNLIMSLLSSLSIDTSNFNNSYAEKIKDEDIEATEWLLNLLDKYGTSVDSELEKVTAVSTIIPESIKFNNKSSSPLFANISNKLSKYFALLHSLKSDISQLDLTDLFEKDYKLVSVKNESFGIIDYGTSSIPARLPYLVNKFGINLISKKMHQFALSNNLQAFIFLNSGKSEDISNNLNASTHHQPDSGAFGREVSIFFAPNSQLFDRASINNTIDLLAKSDLQLTPYNFSHPNDHGALAASSHIKQDYNDINGLENDVYFFTQNNTLASRKQLIPTVSNILSQIKPKRSQNSPNL
ncbi:Exopolyphosphatase [Smittium culicis]|uniref:Exopolyphosphatase n=1 Tax=Smittium culicis TaxID=133412 RepID=A0A1R1XGP1_9FUNG|nr:Exopolyphosphatase [Smittium culicis]